MSSRGGSEAQAFAPEIPPGSPPNSGFRLHRLERHLGCRLAEFLRLVSEFLHLRLNEFGLQAHELLRIFCVHDTIHECKRVRDVALGVIQRLISYILCASLSGFGLSLYCCYRLLSRRHEGIEGSASLPKALFRHRTHIGRDVELGACSVLIHGVTSCEWGSRSGFAHFT